VGAGSSQWFIPSYSSLCIVPRHFRDAVVSFLGFLCRADPFSYSVPSFPPVVRFFTPMRWLHVLGIILRIEPLPLLDFPFSEKIFCSWEVVPLFLHEWESICQVIPAIEFLFAFQGILLPSCFRQTPQLSLPLLPLFTAVLFATLETIERPDLAFT